MPVKKYKPTSPGRRDMTGHTFEEITRVEAAPVTADRTAQAWRSQQHGPYHRPSSRRRSQAPLSDDRLQAGQVRHPARVESIEYDPNRSARIALLLYADGEHRYIIAPLGLQVGDSVMSGAGCRCPRRQHAADPEYPGRFAGAQCRAAAGRGGQLARAAGTSAQLLAKEGTYAQVRLPSGEVRRVHENCMATIGQVGNTDHGNIKLGKAGRKRWLGWRPTVRGTAMDPNSHPHGGGEGRSPIGMPGPKTPWGKPAMGKKTRRNKRTDKFIVRRRGKRR